MLIHAAYKLDALITRSAAEKKKTSLRPTLDYVWIGEWDGKPVAAASDGRTLVVAPITLNEGDVPGLLEPERLTDARKAQQRGSDSIYVGLNEATVWVGGTELARFPEKTGTYPTIERVVPRPPYESYTSQTLVLSARQVRVLSQALGDDTLAFLQTGAHKPLLVKPLDGRESCRGDAWITPPFAVLMPALLRVTV